MTIIIEKTEKEGRVHGKRFLQGKTSKIRFTKQAVKQYVESCKKRAEEMNKEDNPINVIESLFSPATFSY